MGIFEILPSGITLDILTRLPFDSVLDCKLVCTNWRNLISHHPLFSKLHLHHLNHPFAAADPDPDKLNFLLFGENHHLGSCQLYYLDYNEKNHEKISRIRRINLTLPFSCIAVVGSINGLVCLYGCKDNGLNGPACVCNPMTKEYVMLPECKRPRKSGFPLLLGGFGYLPSTNQYKVVRIQLVDNVAEVEVYILGSGSGWRNLGKFESSLSMSTINASFANGALHWMGKEKRVVVFDLAEEKFYGQPLPPPSLPVVNSVYFKLGVWDGQLLYYANHDEGDHSYESDIWILKTKDYSHAMKEQEKHQSSGWSKEFSQVKSEPFAFTKSGCALCCSGCHLSIYDPKSSTSTRLADFGNYIVHVLPHTNSFVTLKELGEEDVKIMDPGETEQV